MNYAAEIDRAIDTDDLAHALFLAEHWVVEAPEDAGAWSKLAHVHEMSEDFVQASDAISKARKISPDYPPYLFKHGYVAYRLGNYAVAESAFGRCVEQSEKAHDSFYLDAARIAQARCFVLNGQASLASHVIAQAADGSATWLDRRFSKEEVANSIQQHI